MSAEPNSQKLLLALTVHASFKGSHTVVGYETPHFHLWEVSVEFQSDFPLQSDRLIDLVFLQNQLDDLLRPVDGKYLNSHFDFSPTSENLAQWLWGELVAKLPNAPLTSVSISICNLEGKSMGVARLFRTQGNS